MPAELRHPPPPQWRVNLRTRSRNFSIEVRAATPIPTWRTPGHHHVSVLLRLWSFVLRLQSDCGAGPPRPHRRSLGSRFLRALERVRGFRANKQAAATCEADKAEVGIVRLSLVPVLISAFLLGAVTARRLDKIGAAVAAVAPTILGLWSKEFFAWQGSFAAAAGGAAGSVDHSPIMVSSDQSGEAGGLRQRLGARNLVEDLEEHGNLKFLISRFISSFKNIH